MTAVSKSKNYNRRVAGVQILYAMEAGVDDSTEGDIGRWVITYCAQGDKDLQKITEEEQEALKQIITYAKSNEKQLKQKITEKVRDQERKMQPLVIMILWLWMAEQEIEKNGDIYEKTMTNKAIPDYKTLASSMLDTQTAKFVQAIIEASIG